jgi:hypothetical protein
MQRQQCQRKNFAARRRSAGDSPKGRHRRDQVSACSPLEGKTWFIVPFFEHKVAMWSFEMVCGCLKSFEIVGGTGNGAATIQPNSNNPNEFKPPQNLTFLLKVVLTIGNHGLDGCLQKLPFHRFDRQKLLPTVRENDGNGSTALHYIRKGKRR